jgi:hypothetical protein
MSYILADLQITGRYFADGVVFKTKKEIKDQLISFHSTDTDKEDIEKLKKMSLNELLDLGEWRIDEIKESEE